MFTFNWVIQRVQYNMNHPYYIDGLLSPPLSLSHSLLLSVSSIPINLISDLQNTFVNQTGLRSSPIPFTNFWRWSDDFSLCFLFFLLCHVICVRLCICRAHVQALKISIIQKYEPFKFLNVTATIHFNCVFAFIVIFSSSSSFFHFHLN